MEDARPHDGEDTVQLGEEVEKSVELPRGACVGRYVVLATAGAGGMGVVYRAYDPELERTVALKLLHERSGAGSAMRERLLREAKALARLSHPNVVAVYDAGTFEERVFLATEFVEGRTLRQWVRDATPTPKEIIAAYAAAGDGLAAAHRVGLVHRDFKPDNVLFAEDGRIRVLDFGLARSTLDRAPEPLADSHEDGSPAGASTASTEGSLGAPLTRHGTIVGTPRYMAPEQRRGGQVDARSDQYSFCVALEEALGPSAPRHVRKVIARGLAKKPDDRYLGMTDLLVDLRRDPGAVGRRTVAAVLLVASGVLAFSLVLRARRAEALVCNGGEAKLVGVWDGPRRDAVRAAFAGSSLPFAADAFRSVSMRIDAYTKAWVAQRREACVATRLRGEQSEELLDLRMQCLETRLEALRAQTDIFASADGPVVERAVQAAQALPELAPCNDAVTLRETLRLPRDPALRSQVESLRKEIARANALQEAGRVEEGLALAHKAAEAGAGLHYRPVEAEALLALGRLQDSAADYKISQATLESAVNAAVASRHDEVAARAWLALVWSIGERQWRFSEARIAAGHAQAAVERMGNPGVLNGDLLRTLDTLSWREGKFDESLAYSERCLEVRTETLGPDHPAVAECSSDIADLEVQAARYERGIARYQQAIAILERAYGKDHPAVALRLNNLSIALMRADRIEEALAVQTRAVAMDERALGPSHPQLADALNNLGDIHEALGRSAEANQDYARALAILEHRLGPDHPQVGTVLFNIAAVLTSQGRFAEAKAAYERTLSIFEKAFGPDHFDVARTQRGLGETLLQMGKPAEGLALQKRALAAMEKSVEATHPEIGNLLVEMVDTRLEQGALADALALSERAMAIAAAHPEDAALAAEAEFARARALTASGASRAEVAALLTRAQRDFVRFGGARAARRAQEAGELLGKYR